jgi:hypothetical protein
MTPGERLGPYETLEAIGTGGMGEVHQIKHLALRARPELVEPSWNGFRYSISAASQALTC